MQRMYIYETAMCCPTGLCGVGIDKELLRISTVLNSLERHEVKVERFNLSNSPDEFIKNKELNKLMMEKGVEILPVTTVDNVIVKTGSYPTNEELIKFLDVPPGLLEDVESKQKQDNVFRTINEGSSGEGCC